MMAEYLAELVDELMSLNDDNLAQRVIDNSDVQWCLSELHDILAVDVAPVVHGRCPICSGRKILTQDCDNGYSVEVDAEQGEMSIWQGDTCLTVISIDYCPNCGAKMDGGAEK